MQEKIAKLLELKSIVTIALVSVFSYLSIIGTIEPKDFMVIFGMVITYYFSRKGTQ